MLADPMYGSKARQRRTTGSYRIYLTELCAPVVTLLEAVPNVSEGRDARTIAALAKSVSVTAGASLLDSSSDPDHHRTVLTLAGEPEALNLALLELFRVALESIDLRRHRGVHPRVGAVDVVPFVPLGSSTMSDAVTSARSLGRAVAARFEIPVYLYGEAAPLPQRRFPTAFRRFGLDGLGERMARDASWAPDFGPSRLHPTAGAALIGAREPLIAFNALLASDHLDHAKALARSLRESSGGLPAVQAIGVSLARRGRAQVSMNLLDYRRTPPLAVVRRLRALASGLGEEIEATELVGLIPRAALAGTSPEELYLEGFSASKILEVRLAEAGLQ